MKIFRRQQSGDIHQVVALLGRPTKMKEAICQAVKTPLQLGIPNLSLIHVFLLLVNFCFESEVSEDLVSEVRI